MKNVLVSIVVLGVLIGAVLYLRRDPSEGEQGASAGAKAAREPARMEPAESGSMAQRSTDRPGPVATSGTEQGERAPAPPANPDEESQLLAAAQRDPGPDADPCRIRLAEIWLQSQNVIKQREAQELLTTVWKRGDRSAPQAAHLLVRSASDPNIRLASASYLREQGASAPGYLESLVTLGRSHRNSRVEAERVQAWHELSEAYFARDEAAWRDSIRPDLDALARELVFSPTPSPACATYKVKSGDTLVKIAKSMKTTVDLLRWLNGLEKDMIHPGKTLKVMTGVVSVEVSKRDFRLDVRLDGRYLYSTRVGLGKQGRTPVGEFVVDLKQEQPAWQKPGQKTLPYGDPENPLGDRWLGFADTEELSGYGMHGTKEPDSIGTESSEGCIRMLNEDVVFLYRLVPIGTKVSIRD